MKGCKTNSNLLRLSRGDKGGLPLCNLDQESGLALQYMTQKKDQFPCSIGGSGPQRSGVAHIKWLSLGKGVEFDRLGRMKTVDGHDSSQTLGAGIELMVYLQRVALMSTIFIRDAGYISGR